MSAPAKIRIPAPSVSRIVLFGDFKNPRPALVLDVDPRIPDLIKIAVFGGPPDFPPDQRWSRYGEGKPDCWWWPPPSELVIEVEVRP